MKATIGFFLPFFYSNISIQPKFRTAIYILAVQLCVFTAWTPEALAACASPVGAAGEIIFNTDYNTMQFCDGSNWMAMGGTASTTDARIGTLTANKWCAVNAGGTAIDCTSNTPGGSPGGANTNVQFNSAGAFGGSAGFAWDSANQFLGVGRAPSTTSLAVGKGSLTYAGITLIDTGIAQGMITTDTNLDMTVKNVSNGKMFLGTNNTTRMTIDASGNVGIGTAAPGQQLSVMGNAVIGAADRDSSGNAALEVRGTGQIDVYAAGSGMLDFTDGAPADFDGRIRYDHTARALQLYTAQTERVRVDSAGNVGIGTASPTSLLHVNANVGSPFFAGDVVKIYGNQQAGSAVLAIDSGHSPVADRDLLSVRRAGGAQFTVRMDGNVGIGSGPQVGKLYVSGAAAGPAITGYNSSTHYGVQATSSGSAGLYASTEAAGSVGAIGYAANGTTYGILGSANAHGVYGQTGNTGVGVYGYNTASNYGVFGYSVASHGVLGRTAASGGIGVYALNDGSGCYNYAAYSSYGTYTNCNSYVTGTLYYGALSAISDGRLKENVKTVLTPLNKVLALHPVTFSWKKDTVQAVGNAGTKYGFIAQEVREVIPEIVREDKRPPTVASPAMPNAKGGDVPAVKKAAATLNDKMDSTLSVDYSEIIPVTVGAIQELKHENDALKAANDNLMKSLDDLRHEVEQIRASKP